jgi:tRNA dimethylallyltransferase
VPAPVILLVGPTASGKSAAALSLAQQSDAEIVSIDSALVYRDMSIGTAKPSPAEMAQVPHHLIDLITPIESYSVARFVSDCLAAIAAIHARGRMPLLVGGTMMYANILVNGMSGVPPSDPTVREVLTDRLAREGVQALHEELRRVDPATASRLPATDTQRIERALEVWMISGTPLSAMQGQRKPVLAGLARRVIRWMPRDRAWLHERCEARLHTMFEKGFVDEVESLRSQYELHAGLPSMRCVGYRQVLDTLEGRATQETLFDRSLFATRQLAKRQITWLRSLPGDVIDCDAADALQRTRELIEQAHDLKDSGVSA